MSLDTFVASLVSMGSRAWAVTINRNLTKCEWFLVGGSMCGAVKSKQQDVFPLEPGRRALHTHIYAYIDAE